MKKEMKITKVEQSPLSHLTPIKITYLDKENKERIWELVSRGSKERIEDELFNQGKYVDAVAVFAVNREKDKVVLLKEERVACNNFIYTLPAGIIDDGEDLYATAIREFKEETGLNFTPKRKDSGRYSSTGISNEKVAIVYGYFDGEISTEYQSANENAEILIVGKEEVKNILENKNEEVAIRTALLLQDFFKLNDFFNDIQEA